ncbi:MAG: hypothetical protein ICCCNLDF_03545 [Planctomycetes bacterium]|nr:hypothetical protein [Planctomycetota bacterium]
MMGKTDCMRCLSALLIALALFGCSGGNSASPPPSPEQALIDRLSELCREAEKSIPNASNWAGVLNEVTYQNDGRVEFMQLAREQHEALPPIQSLNTAEQFMAEMKEAQEARDAEAAMSREELDAELAKSLPFSKRYAALLQYDSLAVLAPREDWSIRQDTAVARLLDAMSRRLRLLCLAGRTSEAESELLVHLEVLGRLDRDSNLRARMWVNGEVLRLLRELVQGSLTPLAESAKVQAALEPLYEHGDILQKRAWLREFKYWCAFYSQASRSALIEFAERNYGERLPGLQRMIDNFSCELEFAKSFESHAPDLLDADEFSAALSLAKACAPEVADRLSNAAYQEARWKAGWLGYRLYLAGKKGELTMDSPAVKAGNGKYPGTKLEWQPHRLEVRVDPAFPAAIELGHEDNQPVLTIPLS